MPLEVILSSLTGYYESEYSYKLNFCLCLALISDYCKNNLSDFHRNFYKNYVERWLVEDRIFCLFDYFSQKKFFNFEVDNAYSTNTDQLCITFREDVYRFLIYEHFYHHNLGFSPFGTSIVNQYEDLFVYNDFEFKNHEFSQFHSMETEDVLVGEIDIFSTPRRLVELDEMISNRIYQFRLMGLLGVKTLSEVEMKIGIRKEPF